jgi:hypothetical protein
MTKMIEYVELMQMRLSEVAKNEQTLIRALGEALCRVDQELLADVRDITLSHESRRVAILDELQNLASRIGAFPAPPSPAPFIEASGAPLPGGVPGADMGEPQLPGDWRKAVSNIKDELDGYFGRTSQH